MKKTTAFLSLLALATVIFSQEPSPVKWITFKEAQKLDSLQPRPWLIDVYTDWCVWCKVMMEKTYSNQSLANYINNNFYAVQLNAEKDDSIYFAGKLYRKVGKNNQLAVELLNGQMSYPTTVFIARNKQKIAIPGFLDLRQIEPYLVYFAEGLEQSADINEFHTAFAFTFAQSYKDYIPKIPEQYRPDTSGVVQWHNFKEFDNLNKDKKRKYIVFSYVSWITSCKVMKKITFSHPHITKLINENFVLLELDAASPETYTVKGKQYKSLGQGQPNELAMELFQRQFSFPALFFFDENFNPITSYRGYANPKFLEIVLNYIISNQYKTKSFDNFAKDFKPQIN